MIRATAPGKLMICGEYSILSPQGRALAVAVEPGVTVTVETGGDGWRVSSPALSLVEARAEKVPLVVAALRKVGDVPSGGHVTIESDLGVGSSKLGLGASAAICVATVGALRAAVGREPLSVDDLDDLTKIHRAAQGGRGSGYDVATCLLGGVCLFESTSGRPHARRVDWPSGLHASVLYTGRGASTPELVARLEEARNGDPALVEPYLGALAQAADTMIDSWVDGDATRILDAAAAAQEALDILDRAVGMGILEGTYGELLAAIEDAGAIGRTAGAGGGDCAWALSDSSKRVAMAVADSAALGFERLDLNRPARGLEVLGPEAEDA